MIIDLSKIISALERIELKVDKLIEKIDRLEVITIPDQPEEPEIIPQPNPETGFDKIIDFTDEFYRLVEDPSVTEIYLEENCLYLIKKIKTVQIIRRDLTIYSGEKRAVILLGVENYSPVIHGKQSKLLFMLQHDSFFTSINIDWCQPKQLKTVEYFNPKLFGSLEQSSVSFGAIVMNCDTTRMGENGGLGTALFYGGLPENHVALINFKHYGVGFMDAKNPFKDAIMYVSLRDVNLYAGKEMNLSDTDKEVNSSLQDNILTIDYSTYFLSSAYNWTWKDNDSSLVLYKNKTFFLDGYNPATIVSDKALKIRTQAKGLCNFGVLDSKRIYSNSLEMHAGDQFNYKGEIFTVISKNRIAYPFFDARTTDSYREPDRARALVYELDKEIKNLITYPISPVLKLKKSENVIIVINEINKHQLVQEFRERLDPNKAEDLILINKTNDELFEIIKTTSQVRFDEIEIEYLSEQINFVNEPVTLLYKANDSFRTDLNTVYRGGTMLNSRGIGHLSYNHSSISMNAENVNHEGFYRGSRQGKGKSILWNMVNCKGFEESNTWFMHDLPITTAKISLPKFVLNKLKEMASMID